MQTKQATFEKVINDDFLSVNIDGESFTIPIKCIEPGNKPFVVPGSLVGCEDEFVTIEWNEETELNCHNDRKQEESFNKERTIKESDWSQRLGDSFDGCCTAVGDAIDENEEFVQGMLVGAAAVGGLWLLKKIIF